MKKIIPPFLQKSKKVFPRIPNGARGERGQVLVIVTLSVIALTAIVGLAVDTGILYLNHGKLRRAVDAAALAASAQFREKYSPADLQKAALEFLVLNGINDPTATVETCDTTPTDEVLCPQLLGKPARKLVRVHATSVVKLTFLSVIGIRQTKISASAVSEAASMDVVFVIDASDSMTYAAPAGNPMLDPGQCNPPHDCHPFEEVKEAAKAFVDKLYMPYDRVAVVTFDNGAKVNFSFEDFDAQPDANKKAATMAAIEGLGVVDPGVCPQTDYTSGPCRQYDRYPDDDPTYGNNNGNIFDEPIIDLDSNGFGDTYLGFDCPEYRLYGNPTTCGTTSIGKGLEIAGGEFANEKTFRQEALWVVILLTDGAANGPQAYCPHTTWIQPFCRDTKLSRHCSDAGDTSCTSKGGVYQEDSNGVSLYDADDFAHDQADTLGEDNDVLIFSIGLGNLVRSSIPREKLDANGNPTGVKCAEDDPETPLVNEAEPLDSCWGAGEQLMRYAANIGRGKYYFAPTGAQLEQIFLDIAQNLATRLTQ